LWYNETLEFFLGDGESPYRKHQQQDSLPSQEELVSLPLEGLYLAVLTLMLKDIVVFPQDKYKKKFWE
jgi:hypothetical protein